MTEKLIELDDGGKMAVEEYGSSGGVPVVFCHGWPSSRTMAALTDVAARELGVRVISVDRPGISASAFQRDRKLLDWPPLMSTVTRDLGLDQFRVLAISGGAPYAYVTAWA